MSERVNAIVEPCWFKLEVEYFGSFAVHATCAEAAWLKLELSMQDPETRVGQYALSYAMDMRPSYQFHAFQRTFHIPQKQGPANPQNVPSVIMLGSEERMLEFYPLFEKKLKESDELDQKQEYIQGRFTDEGFSYPRVI